MPSIKSQVQKNAERIAQGGDLVQAAGPSNNAANPTPMPPPPPVTGLPVRGYYPQGMTLDQDFGGTSQITRTGPNMRSPTFPKQPSVVSTIISKAAAAVSSAAASLIIKVNNMLAPNQSVINLLNGTGMIITVDAAGNIVFNSTSSGDGLTHSAAPWESDPAYFFLRDDFTNALAGTGNTIQTASIGQLGWNLPGTAPAHDGYQGGLPPNVGSFFWDQTGTAKSGAYLELLMTGQDAGSGGSNNGWALLDNPGWQCTWVFRLGGQAPGITGVQFPFGEKAMYVGLSGVTASSSHQSGTQGEGRPEVFFGCRYDTSGYYSPGGSYAATAVTMTGPSMAVTGTFTGANQTTGTSWVGLWFTLTGAGNGVNNGTFKCTAATTTTLTLNNPLGTNATVQTITCAGATPFVATAAANGDGTKVVYTATITNGGTNLYVGQKFYVSGFGNNGNNSNGTAFTCLANTTTTITLANPLVTGSGESHAGYIAGPNLEDTQFVLEGVVNPSYGVGSPANFTQGTTLATGVSPATGSAGWHRLDISCSTAGQITMTLDGAHSLTVAVSKQTITLGAAGLSGSVGSAGSPSDQLIMAWTVAGGTVPASFWASGSQVTITGFSGAQAGFNSTFTVLDNQTADGGQLRLMYPPATNPIVVASASVAGTVSGYPSLYPECWFGNDNTNTVVASSGTMWVDFFSFVWNPNLGPNAPGTPTSTLPRYW